MANININNPIIPNGNTKVSGTGYLALKSAIAKYSGLFKNVALVPGRRVGIGAAGKTDHDENACQKWNDSSFLSFLQKPGRTNKWVSI